MLGLMIAPDLNKATVNLDPDKKEEKPSDHWNAAQTSPEVLKLFLDALASLDFKLSVSG